MLHIAKLRCSDGKVGVWASSMRLYKAAAVMTFKGSQSPGVNQSY